MNEQMMVANLLNDPRQVQFLEVKSEWFVSDVMKKIVQGVIDLKGDCQNMADLVEQLTENGSPIALEELESLKNVRGQEKYSFSAMVPYLHKEYVQKQLNMYMAKYQTEGRKKYLDVISSFTEEIKNINTSKDDGLLSSSIGEFEEKLYSEKSRSLKTFEDVDMMTGGGFRPGQLITIGARSGVGKTLVSLNLMMDILDRNKNIRADFFSLEMNKFELVDRILSRKKGINSLKLGDYTNLSSDEKATVMQGYKELMQEYDMALFGEEYDTLGAIKRKIKERAIPERYIAFLDYVGLVHVEGVNAAGDGGERIAINLITRELKLLASELEIPIVILAQLNRGLEYRQDKTPGLQDLKSSGSLEQDSSIVMFLSKDSEEENLMYLDIAKNRSGRRGRLKYNINYSFMDLGEYR